MRKLVFLTISTLFLSSPVFSHPPSDIKVSIQGSEVKCDILHSVADPAKHYIYEVKVDLNGIKVIEQQLETQTDNDKQSVVYIIPSLKKSDKLAIWAHCNKGGEQSKEVSVN
ncbi:MAG: hypothetical protein ABH882_01745 [Candidatus Omnitrophota bacterium]|nr:thiosulfate oxidation carrier complex protein SoxZ [Candidatus Omnitrophota bacterium]MBU1929317.1 thiosulfate oxidation carrier complex protein SoxZ [Candidatus Omnitrophota bacterium]MBU2035609.1 thiosulfate oxidation carrier complex protein SoxZ [Candidatus Omnitrophota bacterium]MBU2221599.1 thiosulfate oxidation carrier complex protein SoxZ [Candidatus Omnitrophota bacterium]MBU2258134.1 thiosulfate oxidation carrier complex protein SoxZ [Candidatus Omnitrophota bacterium]